MQHEITNETKAITSFNGVKQQMIELIDYIVLSLIYLAIFVLFAFLTKTYADTVEERVYKRFNKRLQTLPASWAKGLKVQIEQPESDPLTSIIQGIKMFADFRKEGFGLDQILSMASGSKDEEDTEEQIINTSEDTD